MRCSVLCDMQFKQMRKSLEQRLSRSSSTNSAARNSRDLHSLDSRTSREAVSSPDSMSPTCPQNVASLRAEQRRFNLGVRILRTQSRILLILRMNLRACPTVVTLFIKWSCNKWKMSRYPMTPTCEFRDFTGQRQSEDEPLIEFTADACFAGTM
jgi:hypothetical protein